MTLPRGWVDAPLLDVVELHDNRRIPLNQNERAQKPGNYPYYGANGQVDTIGDYLFEGDHILIAEDGGYFDDPSKPVAYEVSNRFWVNNHAHIIRPVADISHGFLLRALNAIDWMHFVSGTTRLKLTQSGMERIVLSLPPLAEQRRIVAKLDALTARLARARAELDRINHLATVGRQRLFDLAFRGELTSNCRGAVSTTIDIHSIAIDGRTAELDQVPAGWIWAPLGAISAVSGGLTKNSKRDGIPLRRKYLRVANVYADQLRLEDVAEIGCTESEFSKTKLQFGDLLIVEGNGSLDQVGRAALWNASIQDCTHQNHLIRVRAGGHLLSKYALFYLLSPSGRSHLERLAASSSGLHTLSISKVSGLPLPLPNPGEQAVIVSRLEAAFARADRLEAEATRAKRLIDRLESAILAKAFRGELVPQNPADEPASVLLDRIRAERAAAPKAKRGRRAAATSAGQPAAGGPP